MKSIWFEFDFIINKKRVITPKLNIHTALSVYAPTPQNGQKHSNNSSALPTNCLSVFDHFVGLALKSIYQKKYLTELYDVKVRAKDI